MPTDDALSRGRQELLARTGDRRVMELGPVILGRELLIAAAATVDGHEAARVISGAAELFELAVASPDPAEYPFAADGEAQADALMWAGIAFGLVSSDTATDRLRDAHKSWTQVGDPVKSGRCAEELAEHLRATGQSDSQTWFRAAKDDFTRASRPDRVAMVREAEDRTGPGHPSAFLLRQGVAPQSSTVLGSSTADEIRARTNCRRDSSEDEMTGSGMSDLTRASAFVGWGELAYAFAHLEASHKPDAYVQACSGFQLARDRGSGEMLALMSPDDESPDRTSWALRQFKGSSYTTRFFSYWHSEEVLLGVIGLFAGDADQDPNVPLLLLPIPLSDTTAQVIEASAVPGGLQTFLEAGGQHVGFRFQATGDALRAAQGQRVSAFDALQRGNLRVM